MHCIKVYYTAHICICHICSSSIKYLRLPTISVEAEIVYPSRIVCVFHRIVSVTCNLSNDEVVDWQNSLFPINSPRGLLPLLVHYFIETPYNLKPIIFTLVVDANKLWNAFPVINAIIKRCSF